MVVATRKRRRPGFISTGVSGQKKLLSLGITSFAIVTGASLLHWQWQILSSLATCSAEELSSKTNVADACFITCIFGDSEDQVDQPANVEWFRDHWCPSARFDLVTNLPNLPAPGWNKHVVPSKNLDVLSNIVQSREAKFLGWKVLPYVQKQCRMVVYMDGYLKPQYSYLTSSLAKFQRLADQVQASSVGLAQVQQPYFNGMTMTEILQDTIVAKGKDNQINANTTLAWFKAQPDFDEHLIYYLNKYFAYDPKNVKYQELSSWFWETYTTYGGSWRDQPLWAYAIHHFHVEPLVMTRDHKITRGGDLFWTGGTLGWNNHVYA